MGYALWKECAFTWAGLTVGFFMAELVIWHNYASAAEHSFWVGVGLFVLAAIHHHSQIVRG